MMHNSISCIFPINWRNNRTGGNSNHMIDETHILKKLARINVAILKASYQARFSLVTILKDKKSYFVEKLKRFDDEKKKDFKDQGQPI